MSAAVGGKAAVPAKAAKTAKRQLYTDIYVARSDGVAWTQQQIIDDMAGMGTKDKADIGISEPLKEDEERKRAWMIKLGKFVKFNLGTDKNDSELGPQGVYPENH